MPKKLTPRQVAARINRKKRKGLTPEGREALRQAALSNRPWEHSTGPRTAAGKAASRWNAHQHGDRACELLPEEIKAYAALVEHAEAIAPQGKVIARDYLARVREAAFSVTWSAHRIWLITRITLRLVTAERKAIDCAAMARGLVPGTVAWSKFTGRVR